MAILHPLRFKIMDHSIILVINTYNKYFGNQKFKLNLKILNNFNIFLVLHYKNLDLKM